MNATFIGVEEVLEGKYRGAEHQVLRAQHLVRFDYLVWAGDS